MPKPSAISFLASTNVGRACVVLFLFGIALPAGAQPVDKVLPQEKVDRSLSAKLSKILEQQQMAWNRGSIDDFMSAYWRSEQLTFSSGGKTQRGWKSTRDRYLERYPTKAKMGQLTFSALEATALGPDHALMLGRWKLDFENTAAAEADSAQGNFSLVWKKINGEWKIIHDHSSAIAADRNGQ
jgi:ketosteroid isomerase-like protein